MIWTLAIIAGILGFIGFIGWILYYACRQNKGGFWTNR